MRGLMNTRLQKSSRILLIGDSCKDIYHYGTCNRLSLEAPVPIFDENSIEVKGGMAANVNSNLRAFGLEVKFLTNDHSIEKHRYVDQKFKNHLLRVDKKEPIKKRYKFNKEDLTDIDIVVISDYEKEFLSREQCLLIARHCMENKIPLFVDTKKTDLSCFEGATIKINNDEYKKVVKYPEEFELIVTMGAIGVLYQYRVYPTNSVEVFDVCGAGDVFLSALVAEFVNTSSVENSIMFANRCAAFSVTKPGTYVLTEDDINGICV